MKTSSFQEAVENQFDALCKEAIKSERINYMDHLCRLSKKETTFSDIGDSVLNQFSTNDIRQIDFHILILLGLPVFVENDLLHEALKSLSEKKRDILLLYYFMDMSDAEIAQIYQHNRSTVYRHRQSGLKLIKTFMEETI